ncbi:MAG: 16S rRNA (cytosine(1402)-N(4))-methyltransferase [Candidatus Zambryskibacteria bacterium RIFCSPHIGHO2_01_FULL_49_18]|uniref:Ribosomal RNA small subunit methyltransferase H n=2 Tax=Candidatus Zambryskiibacteriota TaxID=1817925 RepID=A0A1G2T3C6_9BACT|nr:MAG: 16S rRNA (cytosine(1402)-N(4))-methyltransferase [Candidatus Zambryskibacteria bacterium RIFCSPHIGHO2_01_FULL_49_18]OHB06200.1 MAG: 16S rRNA (cytosine(1402)-N(4))-methyltransferase [Candidatus Zambryskibacteria bacterium RIFCSPLOWO2_01_FULL_47_14]
MSTPRHKPVLLQEVLEGLNLSEDKIFVDGTYGGGGHSAEVKRRYGDKVQVITIDQDPATGADTTGNFRDIEELLGETRPDAILLDLGISSDQLENSGRGFSFQKDEPLDMRMGQTGPTATDILNSWDEHAIELVLRGFGEERFSKKIAKAIVERREVKPFETTTELVDLVLSVRPRTFRDRIHPATKTFQALRIAVNEELSALEEGLEKGFKLLKPEGRFAVISFHSLEDRIVKNFFRDKAKAGEGKLVNKKPIISDQEELVSNPRARSAKLRVIQKL